MIFKMKDDILNSNDVEIWRNSDWVSTATISVFHFHISGHKGISEQ
jgi:hypothetical protein